MGCWVNLKDIKRIVDTSQYSDSEILEFIGASQKELNSKITQKVEREFVEYLDGTRTNKIDGINKTFYVANWKGNYLADMNYDNVINKSDVLVYSVDKVTQEEKVLNVSSIDISNGSFTLEEAPTQVDLYVTYSYSAFNGYDPHPLLSLATTYLTASYVTTESEAKTVKLGNVSISGTGDRRKTFHDKYLDILNTLMEESSGGSLWGESFVLI